MKFTTVMALAAPLVQAAPSWGGVNNAVYFLDSDPEGASIVSLKVSNDGTLSSPVRTSTGGKGLVSSNSNGTVTQDPLFSQDSVHIKGNRLFTVNAGSNTLASFWIPNDDPQHPGLTSEPVSTVGDVPNSVAYSEKWKIACVTNTGTKAGVQCFSVSSCGSLVPSGDFKPLPIKQTVPPVGPPSTVSDIVFNPSESAVFVTVKGNGMDAGYIYAYPVEDGKVSDKPVISRPEQLKLDFSMNFISEWSAVITDPSYGASIVNIANDLTVTVSHLVNITGQGATCWSAYSAALDTVYVFDGGNPDITTINPSSGKITGKIAGNAKGMGSFDSVEIGQWLYTLTASPAISVAELRGHAHEVQYLDLSSLGSRASWTGMAAWSKSW